MRCRAGWVVLLASLNLFSWPALAGDPGVVQRGQFLSSYALARRGQNWRSAAAGLEGYPLWSYLELAGIRHSLGTVNAAVVQDFIEAHPEHPQSARLRREALHAWARAQRWTDFLSLYQPATTDSALQCHAWTANHQAAPQALEALREAARLWRLTPRIEPACAPAFSALEASGQLHDEHRLQRINAAFAGGDLKLSQWLISRLAAPLQVDPARELQLRQNGLKALPAALKWSDRPLLRQQLSDTLVRGAAKDPRATEVWRIKLAARFKFDPKQQMQQFGAIALAAAIDDLDEAGGWLRRLPVTAFEDPRLFEWAARYWIGRGVLDQAETVLISMPTELLVQPRWRYLQARVLELNGKTEQAQAAYALIAGDTGFYPFLAADRLDRPYAICPASYTADPSMQAQLRAAPGLQRALELRAVGFKEAAAEELKQLASTMEAAQRVQMAGILTQEKWYSEAITLLGAPEFQRYYELRFPRPWGKAIDRNAAAQQLDPAWTSGLIRAESAYNRHARSGADARGLMQLLPGTARHLERSKNTPDLYAPAVNLRLGTRYLRVQLDRFGGDPIATTAAYNAGPGAVERWIPKASRKWRDLWIETMPYFETRDYVAKVLAFSVIYDWRDDGKLTRLGTRLGLLADSPVTLKCP